MRAAALSEARSTFDEREVDARGGCVERPAVHERVIRIETERGHVSLGLAAPKSHAEREQLAVERGVRRARDLFVGVMVGQKDPLVVEDVETVRLNGAPARDFRYFGARRTTDDAGEPRDRSSPIDCVTFDFEPVTFDDDASLHLADIVRCGGRMEIAPLGTMTVTMGSSVFMPNVPSGTRVVIDFADVVIEGERLRARKAPGSPAGDWLIIGPGDVATLDIRMLLQTHDGASVLMHGLGRTDSAKFSSGAPCWFSPLFETNDARYAWLNRAQGVARGTASGKIVTFELALLN